jgi:alkylation response protein AidB-like acyl-CoA dehydrogenase
VDFEPRPEERAIQMRIRELSQSELGPRARGADERGVFERDVDPKLGAAGVLGGAVPKEHGGSGWTRVAWVLALEELGAVDSSWRGFATVQGALCGQCLVQAGTNEQKKKHLPALARGERIYAYAITEEQAGTDLAAIATVAEPDGDGWRIRGEKVWTTNGGVADFIFVFATHDPASKHRGISCFLVDARAEGLRREKMSGRELGHRGSDHARLRFEGVRVGTADLVGEKGGGFKTAMKALELGRLGVAAGAVGVHRACLEICLDFARRRRQFGKRTGDFQILQGVLAELHSRLEASRLLTQKAALLSDLGRPNAREVSVAKYVAVENAAHAANEAVLFLGSRGYTNESPVERHLRDIKGMQIYEGTSHIQRVIIARDLLGEDRGESL